MVTQAILLSYKMKKYCFCERIGSHCWAHIRKLRMESYVTRIFTTGFYPGYTDSGRLLTFFQRKNVAHILIPYSYYMWMTKGICFAQSRCTLWNLPSLCRYLETFKDIVQTKKRGSRCFLGTLKGLLSCFKFEKRLQHLWRLKRVESFLYGAR